MNTQRAQRLAAMMGYAVTAGTTALANSMLSHGFTAGAGDFLPSKDADLLTWATNFHTIGAANATDCGTIAGDWTTFNGFLTSYSASLATATDPSTRTPAAVTAKDNDKDFLVAESRSLARKIRGYAATSNDLLTSLGLTVPDKVPTRVAVPSTQPVLSIVSNSALTHQLRLRDATTPTSNAKPPGAKLAAVFCAIPATGSPSPGDYKFVGLATKRFMSVVNDSGNTGKTAYYKARWVNSRGEEGPDSDAISATIAA